MGNKEERSLSRWPLRIALSLIILVEILFLFMLTAERDVGNISMIVNSVGLIVLSVLTWRGIPRIRWILLAFLAWRLVRMGIAFALHIDPADHRFGGTLILFLFYVVTGLLIASRWGRSTERV